MIATFALLSGANLRLFQSRRMLLLENLALRQQLAVLKRRHPRPRLAAFDKFLWVLARRFWSGWKQILIIVGPETVVRWHRSGFALYWRVISRARRVTGRRRISKEGRHLIIYYGGRESHLGSAAHPWGASHVGIRCFRENDLPLDAPSAERSRARQTLARLSAQSPRSYRCDGLLHSANDHVRRALLLLRH